MISRDIYSIFDTTIDSAIEGAAIETNFKRFLLVLAVSLSVATLPQTSSWFRRILSRRCC